MKGYIDIFRLSKTKLIETFPKKQFQLQGYKTFCKDRNKHVDGVMFYVNKNIPSRALDIDYNFSDLVAIFLEFSLRNKKWLCIGLCKPPY